MPNGKTIIWGYIFKFINVSKRFSSFDYTELDDFDDVHSGYCNKGEILKIKNEYYIFSGLREYYWYEPRESVMRFVQGIKIIKDIPMSITITRFKATNGLREILIDIKVNLP